MGKVGISRYAAILLITMLLAMVGVSGTCEAAGILSLLGVNADVADIAKNFKQALDQLINGGLDRFDASVASSIVRAQDAMNQLLDHTDQLRGKTFDNLDEAQQQAFRNVDQLIDNINSPSGPIAKIERIQKNTAITLLRIVPFGDKSPYILTHTQFIPVGPGLPNDVVITLDGGQLGGSGHMLELGTTNYKADEWNSEQVKFLVPRASFGEYDKQKNLYKKLVASLKSEKGGFFSWPKSTTTGFIIYLLPGEVGQFTLNARAVTVSPETYTTPSNHARAQSTHINSTLQRACFYANAKQRIISAQKKVDVDHEACFGGGGNDIYFGPTDWDEHHACIGVVARPPGNCSATVEAHIDVQIAETVTTTTPLPERRGHIEWGKNVSFEDIPKDFNLEISFANGGFQNYTHSDTTHPWASVEYTPSTGRLTIRPEGIESFQ